MKTILIPSVLFAASPLVHSATFVYDISSRLASNAALNTDGWNDTTGNWIASTFNVPVSDRYARRGLDATAQTAAPDTIFRPNDGGFSFTIPNGTPRITLTVTSRGGSANWEAGLAMGATRTLGLGADLANDNKYYIFDNGTIVSETGTSVPTIDTFSTIMFDFDLIAGTADLIFDPASANTLLLDNVALAVPAATVQDANSLYIRTGSRFAGATQIEIAVIPEPSAVSLGGLGIAALLLRRRRR